MLGAGFRFTRAIAAIVASGGLVLTGVVAAAPVEAATLDVCASGCTYTTIGDAVAAASPGDTVTVAAGTYAENVILDKQITLQGAGAGTTTITSGVVSTPTVKITGSGASATARLTVTGFTITGATGAINVGAGVLVESASAQSNITLDHLAVTGNGGVGIGFNGTASATDVAISNSEISSNGSAGIRVASAVPVFNGLAVSDTTVTMNSGAGLDENPSSAADNHTGYSFTNVTFSHNAQSGVNNTHEVSIFGFTGTLAMTNVSLVGDASAPATHASHALAIAGYAAAPYPTAGAISLTGVTISGAYKKAGLYVLRFSDVSAITMSNVDVSASAVGWGKQVNVEDYLAGSALNIGNTKLKTLGIGGVGPVDARSAQWLASDGTALSPSALADAFAIEGQILTDAVDIVGAGLVRIASGKVFVPTGGSIANGVAAATAGDTVEVQAGTYVENLTVDKSVTIQGPNSAISPNDAADRMAANASRTAEAILKPAASANAAVTIATGVADLSVALTGMTVDMSSGQTDQEFVKASNNANLHLTAIKSRFINGPDNTNNTIGNWDVTGALGAFQLTLTDNRFSGSLAGNGISAWNPGVGSTSAFDIQNNTWVDNGGWIANLASAAASGTISNNVIANSTASDGSDQWTLRQSGILLSGHTSNLAIAGNDFRDIEASGIYLWSDFTGTLGIAGNSFARWNSMCYSYGCDGAVEAIDDGAGAAADVSAVTLFHNRFTDPVVHAGTRPSTAVVLFTGTGALNAKYNWWGSATGPTVDNTHGGTTAANASGAGAVIDSYTGSSADYAVWCESVSCATPVSLSSGTNPSVFGGSVTFTATVPSGATGSVAFKDGVTTLGSGTISGTTATYATSSLTGGSHSITAVYGGDANWATSTSSPVSQVVNTAASATSVASGTNPSVYGGSVTFTATVTSGATGTVTFKDGVTTLGSGAISGTTATYATSSLTGGTHSITAVYEGDSNWATSTSAPVSQVVNTAASTTSVSPSTATPTLGDSVTLTATVTSGATGTVTFKDGSTTLGSGTIGGTTATYSTSALTVGAHSITAEYGGDSNWAASTSSATTVTVQKLAQTVVFTSPLPTGKKVGDTFTPAASGTGGGGTVSITVTTPAVCSIAAGLVTLTGPGICVVAADQASTATYEAAARVTQDVVAAPLDPTVAFESTVLTTGSTSATITNADLGSPSLAFGAGTEAVYVAVVEVPAAAQPDPAAGTTPFKVSGGATFIDIQVTGAVGPYHICIDAAAGQRLWHYESVEGTMTWVDVTDATQPTPGKVCGTTNSLSPFAAAAGKDPQAALVITPASGFVGHPVTLRTTGGTLGGSVGAGTLVFETATPGCTISGALLSRATAGDCVVTASMAGNATYNPVDAAPVTIAFTAATCVQRTLLLVNFSGKSARLNALQMRRLRAAAVDIAASGCTNVLLKGYAATSHEASKASNAEAMRIAKARNRAVQQYLTARLRLLGSSVTVSVKAVGAQTFVASNRSRAGQAANRRVAVLLRD